MRSKKNRVRAILAAAIAAAATAHALQTTDGVVAQAPDVGVHATSPDTTSRNAIILQPGQLASQIVAEPDWLPGPIVPPVPQPAVRPQRLAALSEAQLSPLRPPAPQPITRRQWLAALSGPTAAGLPGHSPTQPSQQRDAEAEHLRACLKPAARALLERIEAEFGEMRIISTCRRGALIAGTGRISRHAIGQAIDFDAGNRKRDVVRWLIANHTTGGTMTYADMSHIHVDIGHHFVALNAWSGR
jgi:hypothetical protein